MLCESAKPRAATEPSPSPPAGPPLGGRPWRSAGIPATAEDESAWWAERTTRTTDCWFDEPAPADRRCWAMPSGLGAYQGLDLELLDRADESELTFLIEAQHTDFEDALRGNEEVLAEGQPFRPRLHIAMH